jgi:hypothetical protein
MFCACTAAVEAEAGADGPPAPWKLRLRCIALAGNFSLDEGDGAKGNVDEGRGIGPDVDVAIVPVVTMGVIEVEAASRGVVLVFNGRFASGNKGLVGELELELDPSRLRATRSCNDGMRVMRWLSG